MEKTLSADFKSRKLLSNRQACELAGISDRTLFSKRMRGEITYIRLGNLIRFRIEDIEAYLSRSTVTAKSEALAV